MKKIVIVDDFEESCKLMADILSPQFQVKYTCDSKTALEFIKQESPDLILLDYKMPHVTGIELCKILKLENDLKSIPIIFISGAVTSDERIETLESGGDDFISKPFHPKELLLRVQKRLPVEKAPVVSPTVHTLIQAGNLRLDISSRRCFLAENEIPLTPKQFDILRLLVENQSKLVSRQTFMSEVWGHFEVTPRNVDSQINYLKKKIDGFSGHITAVPSHGYRLDMDRN